MARICLCLVLPALLSGMSLSAQTATHKESQGFVVAVEATKITLSNVPLSPPVDASGGQTFAMPAPKEGAPPPSWVTESPKKADAAPAAQPKMMMMTPAGDGQTTLVLTEVQIEKDSVKAADFPAGTAVVVTYREVDGKKVLQKIARATKG